MSCAYERKKKKNTSQLRVSLFSLHFEDAEQQLGGNRLEEVCRLYKMHKFADINQENGALNKSLFLNIP